MTHIEVRQLIKEGKIGAAVSKLNEHLSKNQNDFQSIKLLANIYYKNKSYDRSLKLYQHALSINPMDLESLFAYGDMMIKIDAYQAVKILKSATGLCQVNSPQQRIVFLKLIKALRESDKHKEAISFCKKLLKLNPQDHRALNALGQLYQRTEQEEEAIDTFEKLLDIKPDLPQAMHNLAELYRNDDQKIAKAEELYKEAIKSDPAWDAPKRGLTACLVHRGAFDEAKKQLLNLVRSSPKDIENHKSLAQWYLTQGNAMIASTHLKDAYNLDPTDIDTLKLLGTCYLNLGSEKVALEYFEKALDQEEEIQTLNSIANIHKKQKNFDKAIEYLNRSYKLDREKYSTIYFLSECYASTIRWEERDKMDAAQIKAIRSHVLEEKQIEDLPLLILNYYDIPMSLHKDMAIFTSNHQKKANEVFTKNLKSQIGRNNSGILNIGYVSPDFRNHPVGRLMAPLFENHDRSNVRIFGYALTRGDQGDQYRQRIKSGCDVFRDISTLSIKESVSQIQQDKIDILIDLAGHTAHNKPAIYMCKPAPLSCHLMGFPGTVGADYHDYIIGDEVLTPFDLSEYYTEKILQIPNSFIGPYQQVEANIPSRADLGLPEDKFIYAAFNRPGKIEPRLFVSWMNILRATPESVLLLSQVSENIQSRFKKYGSDHGIDPDRIMFSEHLPYQRYLQSHRLLDLFLDTWHYSAGSTLIAALSSGLPALTVTDDTNASRMGACIIHGVGHHELITDSLSAYETKAIELYNNRPQLANLRDDLIRNGPAKDLFNYKKYASSLEKAYSKIYNLYLSGQDHHNIEILKN